jgi:hypothetical protein
VRASALAPASSPDQDGAETAGQDDALGLTEVLVRVAGAGGDPVTQVPDRVDLLG